MRYLSMVSVLPAVDGGRYAPGLEKQRVVPGTGVVSKSVPPLICVSPYLHLTPILSLPLITGDPTEDYSNGS